MPTSWIPRVPEGRILVTGAAGFIGSALVWALNCVGHDDILVCDRLDTSNRFRNLVPLRFQEYIDADDLLTVIERDGFARYGVETIIHLGACSSTTERDMGFLLRNNTEYTKRLARAALDAEIRFVYASSAATYGGWEDDLDDRAPLATLRPLNGYAYSKHLFDLYASQQGWLDQLVGVKYFNVFGPNEAHKGDMRSVVAKAYAQIGAQNEVTLFRSDRPEYADGEQRRDFVYVRDAVAATLFLAADPSAAGLYNVGSGEATTWNTLVGALFQALERRPVIRYIDMPETLRGVYQYSTRAVLDRLRAAGYTAPMTPIEDAVAEYVAYLEGDYRLDPLVPQRRPAIARS